MATSFIKSILCFMVILVVVGCSGGASAPTPTATENEIIDTTAELTEALRGQGLVVESDGVSEPFLLDRGAQLLSVNEQQVSVWEYENVDGANTARLFLTGPNSPLVAVDFIAAPRFYQSGRMIVLFVAIDPDIEMVLTKVLGQPFI